ncbi:hypothetical protein T459_30590 [Capsicum annuum]|uniref:NB-ARC domain-containing protein n=1 Tax=Capsicum annuum TaxID=4072 RepID=A0A2G2Y8R8_CAPAN|nr:hypothetical protein T459_30590 [Capsicum annuum]
MVLQNKSDGCDSRFIQEIVKVVTGNLNHAVLSISLFPVGIDSRFDIMSIYGIGGIGKSTLVKTAYNLNFNKIDCSNFLANVNKTSERHNGLFMANNVGQFCLAVLVDAAESEDEENDDDSILDDDDDDEDEEVTLAEIKKLFGDLSERNGTMLQQCLNIAELKLPDKVGRLGLHGSECPSRLGPSSGRDSDEKVEK